MKAITLVGYTSDEEKKSKRIRSMGAISKGNDETTTPKQPQQPLSPKSEPTPPGGDAKDGSTTIVKEEKGPVQSPSSQVVEIVKVDTPSSTETPELAENDKLASSTVTETSQTPKPIETTSEDKEKAL